MGFRKSMCVFAGAIALMAMTGFAGPAEAQSKNCTGVSGIDWDIQIRACSAVIQSGRAQGKGLAWAFLNRGNAYYEKKDYDRAIADYTEASRLDPKYSSAYNNRGNAYDSKKDYDRAIADFTEMIRLDPKSVSAYKNRSSTYINQENYDRAIADCDEALRLDPKDVGTLNSRGLAYAAKKDYDRAIADFTEAIRLDPKDIKRLSYIWKRAYAYQNIDDYDRANADYGYIIKLAKANLSALGPNASFLDRRQEEGDVIDALRTRGMNYFRQKMDYERASADFTEILRYRPNDSMSLQWRAISQLNIGNYRPAIADFEQVVKIFSKPPTFKEADGDRHRGKLCLARALEGGGLHQALSDCNKALAVSPKNAIAFEARALTYLKLGEFDKAIVDYDAAVSFAQKPAISWANWSRNVSLSLYGRGIAKLKKGDIEGGNVDFAAAKDAQADVAEAFSKYGVRTASDNARAVQRPDSCAAAETHWKSAEEIGILAVYEDHLARFPNCPFASLAKLRLDGLKKNK